MQASEVATAARRRAGLTQRELAALVGVPQSTIARVELGYIDPRVGTLRRILAGAGFDLSAEPRLGEGVDRSLLRASLQLPLRQRIERAVAGGRLARRLRDATSR